MEEQPTIVVVTYGNEIERIHIPEGVRLITIDENAPNDRVYKMQANSTPDEIAALLDGETIGSAEDDRHEAIAHKVNAVLNGEPRLKPVN